MNLDIEDVTPNKPLALQILKRQRSEYIADTCHLEGVNYTVPEINTLLGGTTVGGMSLHDEVLAINQINAWNRLIQDVEQNNFTLSSEYLCQMQGVVAKEEALTWGKFRNTGVTIAGSQYLPPHYSKIPELIDNLLKAASKQPSVIDSAIHVFLHIAKIQPFHDGNKRTGRLMMNGMLLSSGYPAISISKNRELEFNNLMLDWYDSSDMKPISAFIRSCVDQRILKIMNEYAADDDSTFHPSF